MGAYSKLVAIQDTNSSIQAQDGNDDIGGIGEVGCYGPF